MQELVKRLRRFAEERDWEQFHSPKNLSMALSVEVAEIVEETAASSEVRVHLFTDLCSHLRRQTDLDRVVLSGGTFQNAILLEELSRSLAKSGFAVYTHRLVPPNDGGLALGQAAMERRKGAEYDFNGPLLGDLLDTIAADKAESLVVLALLFISPGRHAGPGGDIETICREAQEHNPGLEICISPLIGEHPLLVEILRDRLSATLA